MENSLISIALELFRVTGVFEKVTEKLKMDEQNRYGRQFAWFTKRTSKALEDAGLHIVDMHGQIYDPGMAVIPLNLEDFAPDDILYVQQTMEPTILCHGTVVKTGTVILGRKDT